MTTEKTTDFLPIQLAQNDSAADDPWGSMNAAPEAPADVSASGPADGAAVSYTHLTLPTTPYV